MFITNGNIDSLIKWFERDDKPWRFQFLCLLVAGHLNDGKFFTDVFDKKEILHILSGEDIAIFLFASSQKKLLKIQTGEGQYEILPGHRMLAESDRILFHYETRRYDLMSISEINFSDLHNYPIREDIILTSQVLSNEICRKFRLEMDDIPCILLLAKGEPVPFVIQTRGQADVEKFCKFIKDIRKIATNLPTIYDLDWSIKSAKMFRVTEQEEWVKLWLREAEFELQEALDSMQILLEHYGMPSIVFQELFNPQTARDAWQTIGLVPYTSQPRLAVEFSEIIQKAIVAGDLKTSVRKVARCAKKLAIAKNERTEAIDNLRKSYTELQTARVLINDLCKKYERGFVWKARYRPMKQFIESLLGISKKANDLLSLQETIKKLIKSDKP